MVPGQLEAAAITGGDFGETENPAPKKYKTAPAIMSIKTECTAAVAQLSFLILRLFSLGIGEMKEQILIADLIEKARGQAF